MSGSYVGDELRKEFGKLPAAMLPAGGLPLLKRTLNSGFLGDECHLVLPNDYSMTAHEAEIVVEAGLEVIRMDPTKSVEQAFLSLPPDLLRGQVDLLFGDTFVPAEDVRSMPLDSYLVAPAPVHYRWAFLISESRCEFATMAAEDQLTRRRAEVACGVFRFSDGSALRNCLMANEDLATALTEYAKKIPVEICRTNNWLDFGHYDTYFKARRALLVSRSHTSITADGSTLMKQSSDRKKIDSELKWYESLPRNLTDLVPRIYGDFSNERGTGYKVEYLPIPVMSEMWVYGRKNRPHWERAFLQSLESLDRLHDSGDINLEAQIEPSIIFQELWADKLLNRVDTFLKSSVLAHPRPKLAKDLQTTATKLLEGLSITSHSDCGRIHGDFFFGNLLYETRCNRIFMIDPRGMVGGVATPYGDQRYDLSKLAMSIYFDYDLIIEGRYRLDRGPQGRGELNCDRSEYQDVTEELFSEYLRERNYSIEEITIGAATTLLATLPFHNEDPRRQEAILKSAFQRLERMGIL